MLDSGYLCSSHKFLKGKTIAITNRGFERDEPALDRPVHPDRPEKTSAQQHQNLPDTSEFG